VSPKVTFIVPCYNLGHLLSDCIHSILTQTYQDFEILIMDDCSPDNTAEVARSFTDPRVKHVRNEPNLGHLHNYNKGIGLAQGEYVWLISADDRLRRVHALERYVRLMEENPRVGYAICPAVYLENGQETGLADYSVHGDHDVILRGHRFLAKLARGNSVPAASGVVRRECYEKVSVFPLDLPYAGDWYLWSIFALHYDVAYFAEPLVSYRLHPLNITKRLTYREHLADNLNVISRIACLAQEAGCSKSIVRRWRKSVPNVYARWLASEIFQSGETSIATEEFEESLKQQATDAQEARIIRAEVYAGVGDRFYAKRDLPGALRFYRMAFDMDMWAPKVWAKIILMRLGKVGVFLRDNARGTRSTMIEKSEAPMMNGTSSLQAGRKQA
jgi:glycosyltransferase involved in cell wall biosynthesis